MPIRTLTVATALLCVSIGAAAQVPAISVSRFDVRGATLLTASDIGDVLAAHTGPQTLAGLTTAATAVQSLYRERGFGTVVARVPEQTIADGVVRIEVTEGRLGQVLVTGNRAFERENILRSLPHLRSGTTPNLLTLDTQALVANENPAKKLRLIFQPGLIAGEVDAVVSVVDQPPVRWSLGLDNSGRPSNGVLRSSLSYQNANVMDRDHVVHGRVETSVSQPGDNVVAAGDYRIPLYNAPATLDFVASYSLARGRGIATPAGDFNYSGQGTSVGTRYRHLIAAAGETKQQLAIGMDVRRYENACSIGDFGADGCGAAGSSVSVRPLSLSYQAERPGRFQASVQMAANPWPGGANGGTADFEAVRPGASARYAVLRANAWGVMGASPHLVVVRGALQASRDALVPAEQFGVGGMNTVRGYREREVVGDQGSSASVEWVVDLTKALDLAPAGAAERAGSRMSVSAFVDAGFARNHLGTACRAGTSHCTLAGIGVGWQWSGGPGWTVRADAARALRDGASTARGDHRLHVSLNYQI